MRARVVSLALMLLLALPAIAQAGVEWTRTR